jgi:hypothetical protein
VCTIFKPACLPIAVLFFTLLTLEVPVPPKPLNALKPTAVLLDISAVDLILKSFSA